jgi:hypothetical protein
MGMHFKDPDQPLEKVAEILSEIPADEELRVFCYWMETVKWIRDTDGEYYPS